MFTAVMKLYDAWQEAKWRQKKYLVPVRPPLMNETFMMFSVGRVKILLRFES